MSMLSIWISRASSASVAAIRDAARGAAICGRGALAVAGFAALSAALVLITSEDARERAVTAILSATVAVPVDSPAATEEPRPEVTAVPQRWSDWLASAPVVALEPQQEHVARYLSRRYRVAENAVRQIVGEAYATGRSMGLEPTLILAVMAVESSLNPFAQSSVGAQGLMQVMTRVHSDKFVLHGGEHAALDPIANLKVGSEILKDLIRRGGSVERGLQLYVGAGNLPDDGGYAVRVLGEMGRIRIAAAGDVRSALSAGLRADNRVESKPSAAELLPTGNAAPAAAEGNPLRRAT